MPEGEVAGRTFIKMSALEIYPDNSQYNLNGITWLKEYIEINIDSAIGCPFVVSWLDEEAGIPSDHGTMTVNDDGSIAFDGDTVGSVQDAYIGQVEIDGEMKDALIFKGYLYNQRYPTFVQWLKDSIANGENIKGSIEINGKGGNTSIVYFDGATNEDGTPKMGRIPTEFDFSGLAILYIVQPSDNTSQVIEINSEMNEVNNDLNKPEDKDKIIVQKKTYELNELSYDDIATIISRAFNALMTTKEPNEYHYYYICKFYPQSQTVIFTDWDTPSEYYKTIYTITNNDVTLGDVVEVEQTWTPINKETAVEINVSLIKDILHNNIKQEKFNTKGGNDQMDEKDKKIEELNSKIEDLIAKNAELNTKMEEFTSKITELNTAVVEANKVLEGKTTEINTMTEELNVLKTFKEEKDVEVKKLEINSYFENEIKKNGFTEAELNFLKTEYVDKMNLDGLKVKEAELCVKKVKELNSIQNQQTELNSKTDDALFMSIHNTEKSDEDYSDLF